MKYGCIGEKLGHSFSKEIHARLFEYDYTLRELAPEQLPEFMRRKEFSAVNVTIPYKQAVIPFLDYISDTAGKIGAVNTIVNQNGKLYGYNTDFAGMRALIEKAGLDLNGKKVLIAGSGGTSKTAAAVAEALGARAVYRMSRKPADDLIGYDTAEQQHADAEILINTTPLGMYPKLGGTAVDIDRFENLVGVIDAVYNPLRSALIVQAEQKGLIARGGLYMLVAQAAFAAEKFTGQTVEADKIDLIYRQLLCEKENIVLVGMPGCGKSTVGAALAKKLGRPFTDTDRLITQRHGPITDIFEKQGEKYFRDLESEVIASVAADGGQIIATGGGAVIRPENISLLRQNGRIYFLDRPPEQIMPTEDRPLARDRAALQKRYQERLPLYLAAGTRIDGGGTVEQTADRICEDFAK